MYSKRYTTINKPHTRAKPKTQKGSQKCNRTQLEKHRETRAYCNKLRYLRL